MIRPGDLITIAAIMVGFGVTVFLFRIQREVWVQEKHPDWPNWLAWADYLVIFAIVIALFVVVLPIVTLPHYLPIVVDIGAAACAASIILMAAYIPAILSHYRIQLGSDRKGSFQKGEPAERFCVVIAFIIAIIIFIGVFVMRQWLAS